MTFLNSLKDVFTITMTLFAVIDIIGSIPIIITLRAKTGYIQSGKAAITAGVVMILFLFFGEGMLRFLGVTVSSFAVAGALFILFFAIEMILGVQLFKESEPETASIVPLAFPLVAGAGSLTTILSLRAQYAVVDVIIGIVINLILVYIVLKYSTYIERILGRNGISIIRKIFGIILLAIAIQIFTTNIKTMF